MQTLSLALLGAALVAVLAGWLGRRLGRGRGRWLIAAAATSAALMASVGWIALVSDDAAATSDAARAVVLALSLLLAIGGGGPLTTAVFALVDTRAHGARSMTNAGTVLRGGAWIGALERAAVFATLMTGWPEGLAVVLALKGIGRYPELRHGESSGVAERFIIGTFASALWAAACAGVAWLLV